MTTNEAPAVADAPELTETPAKLVNEKAYFWYQADKAQKLLWAREYVEKKIGIPAWGDANNQYDRAAFQLLDMTDRYSLVLFGGRHRVIDHKAEVFAPFPLESLHAMHEVHTFPVYNADGKQRGEITVADLWRKFPYRRNFINGAVFAPPTEAETPRVDPTSQFNIFLPFRIGSTSDRALYQGFRGHLFDIVCQGDEERFQFVMSWFSDILRNPGRKTGSALVMTGDEGTGKTFVGEQFAKIVGKRHSIVINSERQLLGNFNAHLAHALFCVCEEAIFAGSPKAGVLKHLVTNTTLPVEYKGIDIVNMDNFTRLMMCSNEDWVVSAGSDARRWFVTEVTPEYKGNKAYFRNIIEAMNAGGRDAWATELMGWDINEDMLRDPPNTWELEKQRLQSFNAPKQFFIDLLVEGSPEVFPIDEDDEEMRFPVSTDFRNMLYRRYEDYIGRSGSRYDLNRTKFQDAMDEVLCLRSSQKKVKGANQRRYNVPPLETLREQVAERLKIDVDKLR